MNKNPKILIVEDEPMLLNLVAEIFKTQDLDVDTAVDGADALKKIQATLYDIVLTDVQMPNIGGIELCRTVKSRGDLNQPSLWIALTAHMPEDLNVDKSLNLFDESFFKPLSPTLLAKVIKKRLAELAQKGSADSR